MEGDKHRRDRPNEPESEGRREFIHTCSLAAPLLFFGLRAAMFAQAMGEDIEDAYDANEHHYGMGVDVAKCIGCGRCVEACKTENDVPREPFYFRTWIERYVVNVDGETVVDSPDGGIAGFPTTGNEKGILRTFFVPKLCNQCDDPPCVQVCPVGATFTTEDGVTLVDQEYCIGCRYCIQACPYGARYLDPRTHTAEKCTFCYHRLVQGLTPACVEVCPTGARIFGDTRKRSSPLARFTRMHNIHTLKPHLNTKPKVYYANLDEEVS
jgi:Fe-S-cluster-containing dehydrogenase component